MGVGLKIALGIGRLALARVVTHEGLEIHAPRLAGIKSDAELIAHARDTTTKKALGLLREFAAVVRARHGAGENQGVTVHVGVDGRSVRVVGDIGTASQDIAPPRANTIAHRPPGRCLRCVFRAVGARGPPGGAALGPHWCFFCRAVATW